MKQAADPDKLLFEIAEAQQGLFTAKQAEEAGYIRTNHAYHVKAGRWTREARGIFRLTLFPHDPEQQLVTYALWSRDREGKIQGVYSHETALRHHELSDLDPKKLHMTVPNNFRRNSAIPKILELYHNDLPKADIQESRGFLVTTPIRTIQDALEGQTISFDFIEQAIKEAIQKGLIRKSQLQSLVQKIKLDDSIRRNLNRILGSAK